MKKSKPARKAKKKTGPPLPIVYSEDVLCKVGIASGLTASAKLPVGQRPPVVINGVVLPGNLVEVATDCGSKMGEFYSELAERGFVGPGKHFTDEVDFICKSNRSSLEKGFVLAILRYADELKSNPEASAMLAAMLVARKKGLTKATAKRKQKNEPARKAIRKQFRELRKDNWPKGKALEQLMETTGKSNRQLQRDTKGLT